MITYIERGDIFNINGVNSYAHGCNCAGAMGKGIALQFRNKFPDMYARYNIMCKNGSYKPGDVFDYNYGAGHVYNLGTQETWRTKARLEYIEQSVRKMLEQATKENVNKIALPAIGAGLGGLKWDDVKEVLNTVAADFPDIELYVVEAYQNNSHCNSSYL
ncbi:MAG: macro domain-containing protein [Muribaculaceae bacterium]|nr:macro domain-containing protein [Muribaculaceae bacterium]